MKRLLTCTLCWFLALPSWGAVAIVQDVSCAASNSTTCVATMAAMTGGNTIVILSRRNGGGHTFTGSGGCAGTWSTLKTSNTNKSVSIACCTSATAGATSVTGTWSSKGGQDSSTLELSGASGCTQDAAAIINNGTSTNPATGNMTTANAADILLATYCSASAYNSGPTGSFNATASTATDCAGRSATRIVSSTGTYSTDWTTVGSDVWDVVMASLQASGGGGTAIKDVIGRGVIPFPR